MSRPRVLTCYLDNWYGRPETGAPSSEQMQFGGGLFDQMGFEEIHVPMEWFLEDDQQAGLRRAVNLMKSHYPYEWAFVVPFKTVEPILKEIAREAPVLAWMSDCVHRYSDFGRYWAGAADFIVTTDAATLPKYGAKGILSNWACRPEWAAHNFGLTRLPRFAFTGQMYGDRAVTVESIQRAGDIMGYAYNSALNVRSASDYFCEMAESAFTLCLTDAISGRPQMKSRLFEPQILGSILVTQPTPRLEEYWVPGEECIVFHSPVSAQEQMRALLADSSRLCAMRDAAHRRALTEHTYHNRFAAILAAMGVPLPILPATHAAAQEA